MSASQARLSAGGFAGENEKKFADWLSMGPEYALRSDTFVFEKLAVQQMAALAAHPAYERLTVVDLGPASPYQMLGDADVTAYVDELTTTVREAAARTMADVEIVTKTAWSAHALQHQLAGADVWFIAPEIPSGAASTNGLGGSNLYNELTKSPFFAELGNMLAKNSGVTVYLVTGDAGVNVGGNYSLSFRAFTDIWKQHNLRWRLLADENLHRWSEVHPRHGEPSVGLASAFLWGNQGSVWCVEAPDGNACHEGFTQLP